jgi:glucose/mannose-6-phosphate isomerase
MIDRSSLRKYDPSGMFKIYDTWPELAKKSYEANIETLNFDHIEHIVFSGMGGSGTVSDIIQSILSRTDLFIEVIKGFELPKSVNKNTLVILNSASGNTIETLSTLKLAQNIGCNIAAFSSGGKMEDYCKQNNINYIKTPFFHSPRASLSPTIYTMLYSLQDILPLTKFEIHESLSVLEKLKKQISSESLNDQNPSLMLANWIKKIPSVYYPHGFKAAATRFKNSIHENAKLQCMIDDVVEATHNNIVSWESPGLSQPILIRGDEDHPRTKERWEIVKEYFQTNNIEYKEVYSEKGNILSKLMGLVYLLDYCSIYMAIISKKDPTPINPLDFVKSRINSNF